MLETCVLVWPGWLPAASGGQFSNVTILLHLLCKRSVLTFGGHRNYAESVILSHWEYRTLCGYVKEVATKKQQSVIVSIAD
jgi:hypothetical protein